MLKQQEVTHFKGFGLGQLPGKYSFSSGFKHTDQGTAASWRIVETAAEDPSSEQYWFTELSGQVYSVGGDGDVLISGSIAHAVGTSLGNGLIVDQKGRLLYARREYLGKLESAVFTDDWKDLGDNIPEFRPMELFEDMVLIGNKNKVAVLYTSDDSLVTDAFTLPTQFQVRCVKAGKTGILIAANTNNRGYLILWNGYTARSIAPWIYLSEAILSVATDDSGTWLVTTRDGIYITNGYSLEPYAQLPVKENWSASSHSGFYRGNVLPQGTLYHEGRLFLAYTPDQLVASKPLGVWIHDSKTGLWEHAAIPDKYATGGYVGALFLDASLDVNVSYGLSSPSAVHHVGRLEEAPPRKAVLITDELGEGNSPKHAEAFIASLRFWPDGPVRYPTHTWTVTAKIYDFKRQLHGFGLTNGASASTTTIKNTGNNALYKSAQAGDEVTVLNGANAGEIRHIASIADAGTSTETWTLDSALPNLTESGVYLQIMPFKAIGTKDITEGGDYFFNIKSRPKGKRFLVKLVFETDDTATMIPELAGASFIYDDNPTV